MKGRILAFLCLVCLLSLAGCDSQSTTTSTAAAKTAAHDACGVQVTTYGDPASVTSYKLVGNGYCTAVVSHDDGNTFGRPLVISGDSRAHYAILYMDKPDANGHINTRLVFVGSAEGKASSLAALTPGGNWTPEYAYVFVPDNAATPALTADLASVIVRRVEPVDSVYAFGDAAIPGAQTCATLSDALALS